MRLKVKWMDFYCKVLYCFKPITVILTCFIFMLLIDAFCISFLFFTSDETARDILIAILTGITASTLVAVMIEMANNYQRNDKRWLQLSRLFSALTRYEQEIQMRTGHFDFRKAHLDFMKELHEYQVKDREEALENTGQASRGSEEEFDEDRDTSLSKDRVQCVFDKLPEFIPLIEDAYKNHSGDFRRIELESMYAILNNYQQIQDMVDMELMEQSTLLFGKDPKHPGDLVEWLPKRLKKDLDRGTLLGLAEDVWATERKRIAEILVRQGSIHLEFLGIKIRDELLDDDDFDERSSDETEESGHINVYGRIISRMVNEIDQELLQLRKMIKSEPGFNMIFAYFQNNSAKYRC